MRRKIQTVDISRWAVGIAAAVAIIFLVLAVTAYAGDDVVPNKILVKYIDTATDNDIALFRSMYKLEKQPQMNAVPHAEVLIITDGKSPADMAALVRHHPIVKYADPLYIRKLQGIPNDFGFKYQWYLNKIKMPAAWDMYASYTGVGMNPPVVGIIDTGLVEGNPDINYANVIWGCNWLAAGTVCLKPTEPSENGFGHGTAIAGIIAAQTNNDMNMAGIYSNTKLVIEKACGDGSCDPHALANAIYDAVNHGARILNLSFGGYSYFAEEAEAIEWAAQKNVLIVCAAGNDGNYLATNPYYPAVLKQCTTVGSTTKDDRVVSFGDDAVPWGSNWGDNIAVVAPGVEIYSLLSDEAGYVAWWRGTSFSVAQVVGLAAILSAKCQNVGMGRIRDLIIGGTDTISCPDCQGNPSLFYGHGRIDAQRSMAKPCYPNGVLPGHLSPNDHNPNGSMGNYYWPHCTKYGSRICAY